MTATTPSIRFGLRCSQHHRTWADLKRAFQAADAWGLESAWVFDHIIPLTDPRTGPNMDGWTLLAGLAEATSNVLIGPMVTGITYRNPGLVLKSAVTVDHISNGRCLLGVGAAWFGGEHEMYGIEFPRDGVRVSMLAEALEVFELLQTEEYANYDGKYYQLREAPFFPKPIQQRNGKPHLPVVIGGSGERMLGIIARHADWWDNNFSDEAQYRERVTRLEDACARLGRDPLEIRRSTTLAADFISKPEAEQREKLASLRALGITDFLFHIPDDIADFKPVAEGLIPKLREEWK
ncbi:MAG TPA: LLM class flavin-dependent oxidoreductase [Thermomicrobiales bacterium]|jgi:alkanesulfonate monooxygenase SsuD/methylene tetrahydromethanopterin reductase-like flavin-dependent oxidoreductase (luciferase family)|nr:LLM class F420-dependent oxidoreductase [Chloroflexota bacterium]HBY45602.1 LLM class F420-dependent oxidoreductase [Chloroflexota bacterium]HCG29007.1 LLM class F420-dependent oxidoreductase [Chloroflexota bacterium]HQZ89303.1 LLM class flavin-dependent oxidoreductase [Thermomicrobiales bacterium]HRA31618.1 LLM class flavin-dependent oxidoreductase [Thermomicrobiales bacterium]